MTVKPSKLTYEYRDTPLSETKAGVNPVPLFGHWFRRAVKARVPMANAMTLGTVDEKSAPQARIVLLKDYGPRGFVFFTNYRSAKGRELARHPRATLLFYWPQIERQVRISGRIRKVPAAVSDRYFQSRPRAYRIGAWASHQSEVLDSRECLESRYASLVKKFEGKKVPRPGHWGGYVLSPDSFEFWQGRASRLHDRLYYLKTSKGWKRERLSP